VTIPWDQLPDESDAAYAQFTKYLVLGPERTIARVGKGVKGRQRASGAIHRLCTQFRWVERARQYDIEQYRIENYAGVRKFVNTLESISRQCLLKLAKAQPRTFKEAVEAVEVVSRIYPPGMLMALLGAANNDGVMVPPVPSSQDGAGISGAAAKPFGG
jgi:hypothetical protein